MLQIKNETPHHFSSIWNPKAYPKFNKLDEIVEFGMENVYYHPYVGHITSVITANVTTLIIPINVCYYSVLRNAIMPTSGVQFLLIKVQ